MKRKFLTICKYGLMCLAITMLSCSAEDGKDGLPGGKGDTGDNGENGENGLACWDLNGNGAGDTAEDINSDGNFDALDCQGMNGQDGLNGNDGADNPVKEFFIQEGYNNYFGTQDAQIGFQANLNTNVAFFGVREDLDVVGQDKRSLIRFNDIGDRINSAFDTNNINCGDAYEVDQAILYLYNISTNVDAPSTGYLHLGFYEAGDPFFNEAEADWNNASDVGGAWATPGGVSGNWVGPFPGTDNYSKFLPNIQDDSNMGWIAIPLPREVVTNWICDDSGLRNKGLRLRLSTENATGSTDISFVSSENDAQDLRPLLVIQTQEKEETINGKGNMIGKTKSWDQMSYQEKMAPLHRFLQSK